MGESEDFYFKLSTHTHCCFSQASPLRLFTVSHRAEKPLSALRCVTVCYCESLPGRHQHWFNFFVSPRGLLLLPQRRKLKLRNLQQLWQMWRRPRCFGKTCSAGSPQRASAWRPPVDSLQENASDVDVFNKASLRAVDQKEAQTATVHAK